MKKLNLIVLMSALTLAAPAFADTNVKGSVNNDNNSQNSMPSDAPSVDNDASTRTNTNMKKPTVLMKSRTKPSDSNKPAQTPTGAAGAQGVEANPSTTR